MPPPSNPCEWGVQCTPRRPPPTPSAQSVLCPAPPLGLAPFLAPPPPASETRRLSPHFADRETEARSRTALEPGPWVGGSRGGAAESGRALLILQCAFFQLGGGPFTAARGQRAARQPFSVFRESEDPKEATGASLRGSTWRGAEKRRLGGSRFPREAPPREGQTPAMRIVPVFRAPVQSVPSKAQGAAASGPVERRRSNFGMSWGGSASLPFADALR